MITKEQIDNWMAVYEGGDNWKYVQQTPYTFTDNSAHLKHKLVEAKMLVDRWDMVSTDIIVHSSHKDLFRDVLSPALERRAYGQPDWLWGADIHYSDDMPVDQGMMIARHPTTGKLDDEEFPGRCISVFPM